MNLLKILCLSSLLATSIFAKEYVITQNNSNAKFTLKYEKIKDITGTFKDIYGTINYDEKSNKIESIKGIIELDSLESFNATLDKLILSEKILDSKMYPEISFVATKIEDGKVFGDLTIKDVKRNIELNIENSGVFLDTLYLHIYGEIKRSYFDISWDELLDTGSTVTDNTIDISISIEANLKNDLEFKFIKEKKR